MTHVNNVQSFEKLLGICTGYGGSYNPGKQNLRVENLTNLLMQANEKLLQVSVAKVSYQNAQNDREEAFAETRFLASRIMAELKSSGILPQTVADAAEMMRKIRGYPFSEKPVAADEVKGSETSNTGARPKRSNADFANTVFNFEKLIQTVSKEPQYEPINPDLQLTTLQAKLANLRAMNAAVVTAATAWGVARTERNRFLYQGRNSLHSIAMAVKQQMRATFGFKSEQNQAASKIRFTKLNKL